jgi:hypothetical protein
MWWLLKCIGDSNLQASLADFGFTILIHGRFRINVGTAVSLSCSQVRSVGSDMESKVMFTGTYHLNSISFLQPTFFNRKIGQRQLLIICRQPVIYFGLC